MVKYLYLCTPCGLNDILCCLMRAINYCKIYNRILLFDGLYSPYDINFNDYFNINIDNLIYDSNKIKLIDTSNMSVYPANLNINDFLNYKYKNKLISKDDGFYIDDININFPTRNMPHDIIICGIWGGGRPHNFFMDKFFLKPQLTTECLNNYKKLSHPYLSIQIRNTDIKNNYHELYECNKELIHSYNTIYIATDDKNCIDFFKNKNLNIFNFSTFPQQSNSPLHYSNDIDPNIKIINLFTDILILTQSDYLLSSSEGGFANNLIKPIFKYFKKTMLDKFIMPS